MGRNPYMSAFGSGRALPRKTLTFERQDHTGRNGKSTPSWFPSQPIIIGALSPHAALPALLLKDFFSEMNRPAKVSTAPAKVAGVICSRRTSAEATMVMTGTA